MAKRKSLSKKVRFEVFKRDSFKCQYCGQGAPEVILHVDHIAPVAGGGDNDLMNLITSCAACNAGKGARPLNDKSAIAKQRAQLEELSERREQLEMMLKWREGLACISDRKVDAITELFESRAGWTEQISKWVKRYDLRDLLDAADTALDQYLAKGADGKYTQESANKAFGYIPRICNVRQRAERDPDISKLYYIRGILRNRLHYCDDKRALAYLRQAKDAGASIDELTDVARSVRNWTVWQETILNFISEGEW